MNFRNGTEIQEPKIVFENFLPRISISQLRKEIFDGLSAQNKYLAAKFFYNKTGSQLFEQITSLPEYYPTRTEKSILQNLDIDFLDSLNKLNIIELGSGDHSKISLLISKVLSQGGNSLNYIPLDISESAIRQSASHLLRLFPELSIRGIVADFVRQLDGIPAAENRLFCFLGGTIGNFTPGQIDIFMTRLARIMKSGEYLLLGYDTIKNEHILRKAYNDAQGVTARFNLNILEVVNNLVGTNFDTEHFAHYAFYNRQNHRIEMHLKALRNLRIKVEYLNDEIELAENELIHTENSYKFNSDMINTIAENAGMTLEKIHADKNNFFNIALIRRK